MKKETNTLGKSELTLQVILGYFYGPALVVWNHCNENRAELLTHRRCLGRKTEPRTGSLVLSTVIDILCHKQWHFDLFPFRMLPRWAQQRHLWERGGSGQSALSYSCSLLVLREQIVLGLVPTCHSLVPAGVVGGDRVTGP